MRAILTEAGLTWEIQDRRSRGKSVGAGRLPPTKMVLRDYQITMINAALGRENCLLRAGTGSGKTTVAIALASRIGLYTLIIVWSANLFDQWIERIEAELGVPAKDIGIIRGSRISIKPITVAMQQTIAAKDPETLPLDVFGTVICDEVQRFAAKTLFAAVELWPARYRVGISADESRKDKKEFLTYDLFGDVAADIKRDDLIISGNVLDVEVRIVETDFRFPRYAETKDFNELLEGMRTDEPRNQIILDLARAELSQGQQCFVLSHRREHCVDLCNRLNTSYKSGLLLGNKTVKDAKLFAAVKQGMLSGAILAGVGTVQAIGQALDIPAIGRSICGTPVASNKQAVGQIRGRICRPSEATGKKDAILYYLFDRHVFGIQHVENLIKWNNKVTVRQGDQWIDAREYVKNWHNPRDDRATDFEFLEKW